MIFIYLNRTIGVVILSFGATSFLTSEFSTSENTNINAWNVQKINNKHLIKIVPCLSFKLLKDPYIDAITKNYQMFTSLKTINDFITSILSIVQSTLYNVNSFEI